METEYDIVEARYEGTNYVSTIIANGNQLVSDEPESVGGQNKGFNPFELVIAGLASCTIATIKMYLDRKGWAVESINVKVQLESSDDSEPIITKEILIKSDLQPDQLKRVLAVASKCPTHKLLSKGIQINSSLN
ncbi:MAG: OsmC family protein [Bacteroidetes bacterium]|nr:OsmC family protein [Bacteroidota bacterium]